MNGEILYLSPTYPGSVHDKNICKEEELIFSKKVPVLADSGFQGLYSETAHIILPHKKSKNHDLSQRQETHNRWVSKIRARIEHIIASVKRFRIVKETFRYRLYPKEDTVMLIACALHNLIIKAKFHTN
mgnify:CR=1 FL=1